MSDKLGCQNEVVCNLVKSSLSQARKSYQTYAEMSERMPPAGTSADFRQKALDFARQDADANFDFALKLLDVATLDEVIGLQDAHASRQTAEMARRVEELQALGGGAAEPVAAASAATSASAGECTVATAAATAVLAAGAVAAPLQTAELDSSAIAAEIERSIEVNAATAPVATEPATEGADMNAEIEALAARIHQAKAADASGHNASDADIAAAVAEMDRDEDVVEDDAAEVAAAAAEFEHALVSDDAEIAVLETTAGADAQTEDDENVADVEQAAAEFEQLLLADDEDVEVAEAASELENTLTMSDADVAAASAAESAVTAETVTVVPPVVDVAIEPQPSAGKSFNLDLAAQLDAVRAMIRGGTVVGEATKAIESARS